MGESLSYLDDLLRYTKIIFRAKLWRERGKSDFKIIS